MYPTNNLYNESNVLPVKKLYLKSNAIYLKKTNLFKPISHGINTRHLNENFSILHSKKKTSERYFVILGTKFCKSSPFYFFYLPLIDFNKTFIAMVDEQYGLI